MSNKYPNHEIYNNNINNNNNMNIVEKVDAYWQNEYEIPSLMEMLERRQNLLASMRVESWENDIKPLEVTRNKIKKSNGKLLVEREQIQMTMEDIISRKFLIIENAKRIHNNLQQRSNDAKAKYYFIKTKAKTTEEEFLKQIDDLKTMFNNLEKRRDNMRKMNNRRSNNINNRIRINNKLLSPTIINNTKSNNKSKKIQDLKKECEIIKKRIKRLEKFEIALTKHMNDNDI